jgi:hypothetical protein
MPFYDLYGFSTCYLTWDWLPNRIILHGDTNKKLEYSIDGYSIDGRLIYRGGTYHICVNTYTGGQKCKVKVQLAEV